MSKKTTLLVTVLLVGAAASAYWHISNTSLSQPRNSGAMSITDATNWNIPNLLSNKDRALYQDIFHAQKTADWAGADAAIGKLSSPLLLGHVLAERYLHPQHNTSTTELVDWLNIYNDHPQAAALYALAISKKTTLKNIVPTPNKARPLTGYGDDQGVAINFSGSPHAHTWRKALSAWQHGNVTDAARLFSSITEFKDSLPSWNISAAAYWTYRSHAALGNKPDAVRYLHIAAQEPRSFYGILARKQLKLPLDLDNSPVELSDSDILEMVGDPSIRRIIALSQCGASDLVEKELRIAFPQSDRKEKLRLLALAHKLGMASVQISMASQLGREDRPLDYARYPIPHWQPRDGFTVDPALIYALMRQESGFHAHAISRDGALGLMQIMPKTASYMHKKMGADTGNVVRPDNFSEPTLNIALGQNYIKYLLENDLVQGNLFFLLTAYNAGPGRLQEWKQTINYKNDPLLFVENIPFAETRHYVMQVMANYWIYSELAGNPNRSAQAVSNGVWPDYEEPEKTLSAIISNAG